MINELSTEKTMTVKEVAEEIDINEDFMSNVINKFNGLHMYDKICDNKHGWESIASLLAGYIHSNLIDKKTKETIPSYEDESTWFSIDDIIDCINVPDYLYKYAKDFYYSKNITQLEQYKIVITLLENSIKANKNIIWESNIDNDNIGKYQNYTEKTNNYTNNNKSGFVYLARDKNKSVYKIGCSKDITQREKELGTGNAFLEIFMVAEANDMFMLEKLLHGIFKNKNIIREWFVLSDNDIEYLKNCMGFKILI